jgi:hypothetical protein
MESPKMTNESSWSEKTGSLYSSFFFPTASTKMVRPLGIVRREWKRKGHLGPRSTREEGTTPKWVPVEGRPSP